MRTRTRAEIEPRAKVADLIDRKSSEAAFGAFIVAVPAEFMIISAERSEKREVINKIRSRVRFSAGKPPLSADGQLSHELLILISGGATFKLVEFASLEKRGRK